MTSIAKRFPRPARAGAGVALVALAAAGLVPATSASAAPCAPERVATVLEPATDKNRSVVLGCQLKLSRADVVTKQIVFAGAAASGAGLDCGGGRIDGGPKSVNRGRDMIVIRSRGATPEEMAADRPRSITIANCRIDGSIRVIGLGPNGENAVVKASSVRAGHTERAQAAAPTDITLSNLTIVGVGRSPLYLAPGVTGVSLLDSRLSGRTDGPAIYLDAESGHNRIIGNTIAVDTSRREQVALDGSADNLIKDNRFSALGNGGIYLYRNCGEGGTVRHQAPQRNTIEGNEFYYKRSLGLNPAIWLGSRAGLRWYCFLDRGHPFGSSRDDADQANGNVVIGNRIVDRSPAMMIRDMGARNRIEGNREVAERSK